MKQTRLAVADSFLDSLAKLPKKTQKKVREFLVKFQRNPMASGLNYEKLDQAADDKVRSLRIDQSYRAIVIKPPKGDVFLAAWVDHHDEAYAWVRNRRFEVNPSTGSFQIYQYKEEVLEALEQKTRDGGGLFAEIDEEDLLLAGVPAMLLPSVRAVRDEEQFEALVPHLPKDASEILYYLAAGCTLGEALAESDRMSQQKGTVDVEDFATAMAQPAAGDKVIVFEDEDELSAILEAPLERWRIYLHPSQRKLVTMQANGPVRVLGGAGTGKIVVLMHRARHLADKVFTGKDDRILVTTYTRNLAGDLQQNLSNLCGKSMERIEVVNLHSWAVRFMRQQGINFQIASDSQLEDLWEEATAKADPGAFDITFYREEWDRIIQSQDVKTRDDYLLARRVGRGIRLSRRQRIAAWEVFKTFREVLDQHGLHEWTDVCRETRLCIEAQNLHLPYRAVLSDEVQDFSPNELKLLRALVPAGANDLFIVGDGHQRIYGHETRLSRCGIEIRGRARRLKLNYRTTEQIRLAAVAVLEGCEIDDLDGGIDSLKGYHSLRTGVAPKIALHRTPTEEDAAILETIHHWLTQRPPSELCIAVRTNAQIHNRLEPLLTEAGIPHQSIQKESNDSNLGNKVRLATFHRMKGLEFPCVLLAGVQKGTVPWLRFLPTGDTLARQQRLLQERCLLYVAMTRARDELVVTGAGTASGWF